MVTNSETCPAPMSNDFRPQDIPVHNVGHKQDSSLQMLGEQPLFGISNAPFTDAVKQRGRVYLVKVHKVCSYSCR
jgi:hypothetical protein